MNWQKTIEEHIPPNFSNTSRVWIYQCNRMFFMGEALQMEPILQDFVANWKSHGTPVKGYANLFFGQFIVLMADETQTGVSGCSTDGSVRLIQQLETQFKVHLFERQTLAFIRNDKVELLPLSQLAYAVENKFVTADTLYFNNTVQSKQELLAQWIVPVKDSWLARRIPALSQSPI